MAEPETDESVHVAETLLGFGAGEC
jgi:hypothetical protein